MAVATKQSAAPPPSPQVRTSIESPKSKGMAGGKAAEEEIIPASQLQMEAGSAAAALSEPTTPGAGASMAALAAPTTGMAAKASAAGALQSQIGNQRVGAMAAQAAAPAPPPKPALKPPTTSPPTPPPAPKVEKSEAKPSLAPASTPGGAAPTAMAPAPAPQPVLPPVAAPAAATQKAVAAKPPAAPAAAAKPAPPMQPMPPPAAPPPTQEPSKAMAEKPAEPAAPAAPAGGKAPAVAAAGSAPSAGSAGGSDTGAGSAPGKEGKTKGGAAPGKPEGAKAGKGGGGGGGAAKKPESAEGEGGPSPEGAEGGKPGPVSVEILMPEPPAGLTADDSARIRQTQQRTGGAAAAQSAMPASGTLAGGARAAVTEPQAETQGRAESALIAHLDQQPAPSPEIEELCQKIYKVIRAKRPPDEDSLVKAKPKEMAQEAGKQLDGNVQGDVNKVQGNYDQIQDKPQGQAQQVGQPLQPVPAAQPTAPIDATQATPGAVPAENVSLKADADASQKKIDDAGMNTEAAKLVQTGPVAEARDTQTELESKAEKDPQEALAAQEQALAGARGDMAALQEKALASLLASRSSAVTGTQSQQTGMVGGEQKTREQVSSEAQAIFSKAQQDVQALLDPLPRNAMQKWEAGVAVESQKFEQRLKKVEDWIKERHAGGWGTVVAVWDAVTGLPGWVVEEYDAAEKEFGDGVCNLIREISRDVNAVIIACEALIADARKKIGDLFASLPEDLKAWALEEQAKFDGQLNDLTAKARQTRDNINKELVDKASTSVQEARAKIHALREAAGGLLGKIANAINRFLEDPAKFIIEGLLQLLGIPPAAFWAVVEKIRQVVNDIANDPLKFATNLLTAIGQGFQLFFDNIGTHLLNGLIEWLFSGLAASGITIPKEFSLKAIITFLLEIMGITWPRIRKLLAKHIGEENVALIEKAYEIISNLIALGPEGVFEMIKEKLSPQAILDQILKAAVDYLISALIKAVAARIIALFNPVGAIAQAIEAIYRVLKWIFVNAARIFRLIETVVNGIADILAGNTGGMAKAVEKALASLIAPVIDFLADYIGIGDLPEKIKKTVEGFQAWIEGILDKVIGFLADKAKSLLKALGLGGDDKKKEGPAGYDGSIGEEMSFSADGEPHKVWIVTNGDDSVAMMSSKTKTVAEQLDEHEKAAGDDKALVAKISAARAQHTKLNAIADKMAKEVAAAKDDESKKELGTKDEEVEKEEKELVRMLKEIGESIGANFATEQNPAPVEWPKRRATAYPVIYAGPRTENYLPQDLLRSRDINAIGKELKPPEKKAWDDKDNPIEAMVPTEQKALPDGGATVGIGQPNQVEPGMLLHVTDPGTTAGGGKINREFRPYGFRPGKEGLDGDHVVERQMGGPDTIENLWPLDSSENRGAGSALSQKKFPKEITKSKDMDMNMLKDKARKKGGVWFRIVSTEG